MWMVLRNKNLKRTFLGCRTFLMEKSLAILVLAPFMHYVEKWPSTRWKSCRVHTARFFMCVWPVFNIMYGRVRSENSMRTRFNPFSAWCFPKGNTYLTLSRWRFLSYRNQSMDLFYKSMNWFLYVKDLCQIH